MRTVRVTLGVIGASLLLGAAPLAAIGSGAAETVSWGEATRILNVQQSGLASASDSTFAKEAAQSIVGCDPAQVRDASVQSAVVSDAAPLGESRTDALWIVRVAEMRVEEGIDAAVRRPRAVRLSLNVAIAKDDGRLVVAWTDPHRRWVIPRGRPREFRTVDDALSGHRSIARVPPDTKMQMTLTEVLQRAWASGMPLAEAGQIIVRPRVVDTSWPPTVVDGVASENRVPRVYWIIQAAGYVAAQFVPDAYETCEILMIADDDPDLTMEHYLRTAGVGP